MNTPFAGETYTALAALDDGTIEFAAVNADESKPSFEGVLVPAWTLSDRGTYFVPGAGKKTANEAAKKAPHLYQHWADEPIGRHEKVWESDQGLMIQVQVNEGIERGAEVMSNLRFGVPMGLSAGIERVQYRNGTKRDDEKLNRKTAPEWLRKTPVEELIAITEYKLIESSTVTFAAIGGAKATEVNSAAGYDLARLIEALRSGTLTGPELAQVQELVDTYAEQKAAAAQADGHSTDEAEREELNARMVAELATYHGLTARGLAA
jgi:HK97 family phage prohead protease